MPEERTRSEALNRAIDDWLHRINSGQLRLPSFQRGVAWDRSRTASMLTTIIQDLPLGITLVLDVGNEEKFHSRPLESAPTTDASVTEHLLDGQQRLTALWRALKDNSDVTFFVHVPEIDEDPGNDDESVSVVGQPRWHRGGARFPLWADKPEECRRRGLIPVRLLDPDVEDIDEWVGAAYPTPVIDETASPEVQLDAMRADRASSRRRDNLKKVIGPLRERVRHYNLPYLRLPASTRKDVALRVFINMNTNAKPLRAYDIVVAELENATDVRLRDKLEGLIASQPETRRYFDDLGEAVLRVSALLQGRQPNEKGYFELDYTKFVADWPTMAGGLQRLSELLAAEGIFDSQRVPTGPALPVAAALLAGADEHGDGRARVDQLVRRYLWSSFFTSRYQGAAATRAAADYAPLRAYLDGVGSVEEVPVFNRDDYPLPTHRELLAAGWSKKADRLGRAVLAASTYFGARDFADDTKLSAVNVGKREYHHLFPDALLRDAGIESFLALNCALITWKTNRTIGRLDPIQYLEDRAQNALDPRDVQGRLESHLVPYAEIANAGPYPADLSGQDLAATVGPDFAGFLEARASLVSAVVGELTAGKRPQLGEVLELAKQESLSLPTNGGLS
ncbi:GmrSD restriction endonuclease domain-containing protein [Lacisediminihabitans sp. FW035]